jgi:hypothetical protein
MVMGPVGLGTNNRCAGEGPQQSSSQSKCLLRYTDWSVAINLLGDIFPSVDSYVMADFLIRLLRLVDCFYSQLWEAA